MFKDKQSKLYMWLSAAFVTFLLMAELTGSKLISFLGFTLTLGVIPFPVTFLITDTLNEFYGKRAVKHTTFLGMIMILIAYAIIVIDLKIPAISDSPVDDASFIRVFANSGLVIVGSIIAYVIGQMIDINVFHYLRMKTKNKHIWLRATGSTIISQLIDSYVVIFIAFGKTLPIEKLISIASTNFFYKLLVAISLTPIIYLLHSIIGNYLGEELLELEKERNKEP
jgi:queuosine precursor transporter